MAKETQKDEELIVDVQEQYSKAEQYIEQNKNALTGIAVALAVLVGGYFGYNSLYLAPLEEEAQDQIWKAQQYFEADDYEKAINGDGNYYGFEAIIEEYGATESANIAHYYLGISFLRTGEYELAIENLKAFSSNDLIISSIAKGAIGDALIELGENEEALDYYQQAIQTNTDQLTAPIYLMKSALTYEVLGDFKNATNAYKEIKESYPTSQEARTIDKYIARAEAKASQS